MTRFVVDANAWVEYMEDSEKGREFSEIIENEKNELFTSSANIAEVVSKFLRSNKDIMIALNCISSLSAIINVDSEISVSAGRIHHDVKKKNKNFGMLDAFVAATAKKMNAAILTGDPDFKVFKEAVVI